jgi:predicted enzyme related to lactoylglutathione lyase
MVYLSGGRDLATVLARVEGAGGKILVGKTPITPEYGYFAHFLDTEGNRVGLHSMA